MAEKKEEASPAAAPAKKSKKGLIALIAVAVIFLGAGGGGAWWFMGRNAGDEGDSAKARPAPVLPAVFVALDPFTVNLLPETVGSQYMQVGITLKIAGQPNADKLKEQMPEIRNRMLMILSSKTASELLKPEGKTRLAQELLLDITKAIDPEAARRIRSADKPVNVATAAADTRTDTAEQKSDAPDNENSAAQSAENTEPAEPKGAGKAPNNMTPGPVLGVLFTSFIIQ